MKIQSLVTGRFYEQERMCYILNPKQAALYIKNHCILYDVVIGRDDKIVFVFDKGQTAPYYKAWCDYTLS